MGAQYNVWLSLLSQHNQLYPPLAYQTPIIFFSFICISWRLITLQYCSGFCQGHPIAPAPSTCLMHPTWTGDLFHN